jgi:hypothetical protein
MIDYVMIGYVMTGYVMKGYFGDRLGEVRIG